MEELGTLFIRLVAETKEFASGLTGAAKDASSWATTLGATVVTGGTAAIASGALAATTAIAGIGVAAINVAGDIRQTQNDIQASLGVTGDRAKELGQVATDVFANNWAGSIEEAGQAVAEAERQLGSLGTVGDEELQKVVEGAFAISDVFGADIGGSEGVVSAAKTLMEKFGLSGQEALDFISSGFQQGLDSSGDFLASVTEYGTQFSSGGATADEFFSIMKSGMQQGMLGTDKAADAFKEFRVRIQDGSKLTAESLEMIGINSEELLSGMADGTISAADAFGMVTDALRDVDDQSILMQAGVGLIGTQFEDLGTEGALALDLTATSMEDLAGATDSLNAKYDNFGSMWEGVKRKALVSLAPIGEKLLDLANEAMPLVESALGWFETTLPPIIDKVSNLFSGVVDRVKIMADAFQEGGFDQLFTVFEDGSSYIGSLLESLGLGEETATSLGATISDLAGRFINEIIPAVIDFVTPIAEQVVPGLLLLGEVAMNIAVAALPFLAAAWQFVSDNMNIIMPILAVVGALILAITSPISIVIGLIVLLATAWANNWGGIQEKTQAVIDFIGPYIEGALAAIQQVVTSVLSYVQDWWEKHGESVMALVKAAWDFIKTTIDFYIKAAQATIIFVATAIQQFWDRWGGSIMAIAKMYWDNIMVVIQAAMDIIGFIIDAAAALIRGDWDAFGEALRSIWDTAWNAIEDILRNIIEALTTVLEDLIANLTEAWEGLKEKLVEIWEKAWDAVKDKTDEVVDNLKEAIENVKEGVIEKWEEFQDSLTSGWSDTWDSIVDTVEGTLNPIQSMVDDIISWVNDAIDALLDLIDTQEDAAEDDSAGGGDGGTNNAFGNNVMGGSSMPADFGSGGSQGATNYTFNQNVYNNAGGGNAIGEFQQMRARFST